MARKGLFLSDGAAKTTTTPQPAPPLNTAPLSLLRGDLMNMVREIDPGLIDGSPWNDRFPGSDPEMESLVASLREHGQLVPAMVRPSTEKGRFEIVYGRRRLAAAKEIGRPLKAIIHNLDGTAALIAQGAENNRRMAPSFIEKAVLASRLTASGQYTRDVVAEVIGTHPTGVSRMCGMVEVLGEDLILAIGSCHDLGRRPWQELADLKSIERPGGLPCPLPDLSGIDSDTERFRAVLAAFGGTGQTEEKTGEAAPARTSAPPAPSEGPGAEVIPPRPARAWQKRSRVRHPHGTAVLKRGASGVSLMLPAGDTDEEFLEWVNGHPQDVLDAIHEAWARTSNPEA